MELLHKDLTDLILQAYYKVFNKLGFGFLEKVYENALLYELEKLGLHCEKQKPITVFYEELVIGEYFADIIVEGMVILELKAVEQIDKKHEVQLVNYLKATEIEIGLLLNFGNELPQFKRKIFTNNRK